MGTKKENHLQHCLTFSAGIVSSLIFFSCAVYQGAIDKTGYNLAITSKVQGAVQTFQSGLFKFAVTNCAQCHGSSQTPLFAVNNVNVAYANAQGVMNLANPSSSILAGYSGNGHCGLPSCTNPSNAATVTNYISAIAAAAASGGGAAPAPGPDTAGGCPAGLTPASVAYVTAPMAIPSTLPNSSSSTTGAILRWNLTNISPALASVAGSVFEVQVQSLTDTTYRIILPKMIVPKNVTNVSGIYVLIKQAGSSGPGCQFALGEEWVSVSKTINPSTIPNPLPTTSLNVTALTTSTVALPVLSSSDVISIGFATLSTQ